MRPAIVLFDHLLSGEFLSRENPFSASREPRSRDIFTEANDDVLRAWRRTAVALPGAIVAALLCGPILRLVGLDQAVVAEAVRFVPVIPFFVVGFGVTTGSAGFFYRRSLIHNADELRRLEHGIGPRP